MSHRLSQVTQTHEHHSHDCCEDEEALEEFSPCFIYQADTLDVEVPSGFQAVSISLDGKVKSDLDWNAQIQAANRYREKGLKILWEIDLGLFKHLENPLGHQAQFLSLTLSLEHFVKVIWQEFSKDSVGLSFYKGTPDFSHSFTWDREQHENFKEWMQNINVEQESNYLKSLFCREAVAEYLDLLAARLPDSLSLFLFFDVSTIKDPFFCAELIAKERYPRFRLGIKGEMSGMGELGWETHAVGKGFYGKAPVCVIEKQISSVGVTLPIIQSQHLIRKQQLEEVLLHLENCMIPYAFISESALTTEWDGLDVLLISSLNLLPQTRRKLLGFCAAGGTVVSIGENLQLPSEISFEEWKKLHNSRNV